MSTSDAPLLVGDAARLADKSPATIRGWIRTGRLRVDRTPGGVAVIALDELQKALERRKDNGAAA